MWIAYGILLTLIVFMAEILNWRATISVNGVIAAHLVTYENFNDMAVWNELGIVLVGVGFAIVLLKMKLSCFQKVLLFPTLNS